MEEAEETIRNELFFLHYAPFICVSAREKQELDRIFGSIRKVREGAQEIIGTGELNRLLSEALRRNPPPASKRHRKRLKILYATAAVNERYAAVPVPRYILFVNDKRLLADTYQSYLENTLRKANPSLGLPISFSVRSRRKPEA